MSPKSDVIGARLQELQDRLDACLAQPKQLSDWELDFCSELREKLDIYGEQTYCSARQLNIITRIEDKLL